MKSKGCMIGAVVGAILLIAVIAIVSWGVSAYNGMVTAQEGVTSQWSNVENQYQRRADLIPNLVNTVKGYASHENSTLEAVVSARAKATQITVDPNKLDAASMQKYQEAQGQLSQALGRLLMVTENYPDLKANQNFLELQSQLEGTENRISTERMRFNDTAKAFNTMIRQFPKSILAGMFGFESKAYFQADAAAQNAPKVEF
ncbi:MAG: LemA family protein [Bacteroidales bacterium]